METPPRSGPARARAPLLREPRPTAVQGQHLAALRHVEPPVGSIFCLTFMFQSSCFGLVGRPLTSVSFGPRGSLKQPVTQSLSAEEPRGLVLASLNFLQRQRRHLVRALLVMCRL